MTFTFSIPTPNAAPTELAKALTVQLEPGTAVIFVGANGGGKTRLAVKIEEDLGAVGHRISAHRALEMKPSVPKINETKALGALITGHADLADVMHRKGNRWGSKPAVAMLNDFDFVLQALFAEQTNATKRTHDAARRGDLGTVEPTKFEKLTAIWDRLLPHRELHISGDDVQVSPTGDASKYSSSDMSDGERSIFYLIGQVLVARPAALLIIDEPELHVHRSIMSKLWDELEGARPDCGFVFITHDLEFAACRVAQKFVISDFKPIPQWTLEEVPEGVGFSEDICTLILGSRRPVLFVEGVADESLDYAVYRGCFPDWTVIPRASCENVIHAVTTLRNNATFTRITCAGIVDLDGRDADDIQRLKTLGIGVLPVAEVENLMLLPSVSRAIAETDGFSGAALDAQLSALRDDVVAMLRQPGVVDDIVMRHCRRRIDSVLKKLDLSDAEDIATLAFNYQTKTAALDVTSLAATIRTAIEAALNTGDMEKILALCDLKGLMALAGKHLKPSGAKQFKSWVLRVLRNDKAPLVKAALNDVLPKMIAA